MISVILTHEQADFDAIASQLGVWLLDESAHPVLPMRINRNVRAFLTIYGAELPFVDRRDLPGGPIAAATLVDTQSMITLKGMQPDLRVRVIDHHDLRDDLPAGWQASIQPVGATVTLLVEALRERGAPLSGVQATLMLLGIYEDTGSLTYTRTTSRDLQAAAFLLECGASLQTAGSYLNHPLSLVQQRIYEHLRDQLETHRVHGHSVAVACGDARGTQEELSTIAHKLRDLLEPEALFLLIAIDGGVQLIGRSTSDHIDVAAVARHFGGGGHTRAAAAMVKDAQVDDLYPELIEKLPEFVQPAITVEQIMSRGPQLLAPETPIEDALERMQRYGYEGYPVVENGRIIGLLTRRAVDRAVAHRMPATARSVMRVGQISVRPDQSIEELQAVMTETGWGQVPVVDPDTGEINGIVTRTDLLKTLAPQPAIPGRQNLAERLDRALSPGRLRLLRQVAAEAARQGSALYIVGGFVRDLLLDQPSLDFDLVVEGDAIALAHALAGQHGGRVTAHRRFGTAKWHLPPEEPQAETTEANGSPLNNGPLKSVDLISARTEFYTHPTALPTVERGSIKLDLHRRDFTINTLALRLDGGHYGELHDYWGGLADLRQGLIRVLHSISFVDDPTRMLRAVRFEQRFGFQIENRTLELLTAALRLLKRVSGDRIRHELDHIFQEARVSDMLGRLEELDLLTAIHPALPGAGPLRSLLVSLELPGNDWGLGTEIRGVPLRIALAYVLWLLPLPPQPARQVTRRLQMLQAMEAIIQDACRLFQDLPALQDAPVSALTARLDVADLLAVYACRLMIEDRQMQARLERYASTWRHIQPQTTGHDLRARGLPPGPRYKEILWRLKQAWLDGEVKAPEQESALLESLLQEGSAGRGRPTSQP